MSFSPLAQQLGISSAAQFAALSVGGAMSYPSVLLYQLSRNDSDITLDLNSASWIGSIHGLTGILSIVVPSIMQWKGRKIPFIAACITMIIGWTIIYSANSITTILISESFHGFAANSVIAICYDCLSEMVSPRYRNFAVQSYAIFQGIGMAATMIMLKFVHWRTISIIMCIPSILAIIISLAWPESPLWLAWKGDVGRCTEIFLKLRGSDERSAKELRDLLSKPSRTVSKQPTLKSIWKQIARRDFLLPASHILLLQNHVYWSGVVVLLIYSMELISKTTANETAAFIGAVSINIISILGGVISGVIIRYYKNKPTILTSTVLSTCCLLCTSLATYLQSSGVLAKDSLVCLYSLVGFIITGSLGQTFGAFTVSAELMPVKHRGVGGAWFVICSCSLHATSLKISPYLFLYIDIWGTFLLYAINATICGLLIWKFLPETKDRTLQEIEFFYRYGKFEGLKSLKEENELIDLHDN